MTMPENHRAAFLDEMGVGPLWMRRHAAAGPADLGDVPVPELSSQASTTIAIASDTAAMAWPQLNMAVAACTICGLCRTRKNTVFGVGDEKAKWLFIGEGPGYKEDLQGEPFVGPSGKLLDNMLLAMGLKRGENAYIANIVKCRATDADGKDRAPTLEEAAACRPYLDRQIDLIRPAVIVALGKTAALSLLGSDPQTSLAALRGKVHAYPFAQEAKIPLIVTYHPAYLLRRLEEKSKAWADLCLAMNAYARHPG